jgi:agmatine/peptidylarginine deiminase
VFLPGETVYAGTSKHYSIVKVLLIYSYTTYQKRKEKKERKMDNKEEMYKKVILPLTSQIYDLAKEHGIPFYAVFQVEDGAVRGTCHLPEEADMQTHMAYDIIDKGIPNFVVGLMQAAEEVPIKVVD